MGRERVKQEWERIGSHSPEGLHSVGLISASPENFAQPITCRLALVIRFSGALVR